MLSAQGINYLLLKLVGMLNAAKWKFYKRFICRSRGSLIARHTNWLFLQLKVGVNKVFVFDKRIGSLCSVVCELRVGNTRSETKRGKEGGWEARRSFGRRGVKCRCLVGTHSHRGRLWQCGRLIMLAARVPRTTIDSHHRRTHVISSSRNIHSIIIIHELYFVSHLRNNVGEIWLDVI